MNLAVIKSRNIMKTLSYLFYTLSAALILSSCANELTVSPLEEAGPEIQVGAPTQSYEYVDEDLWVYFERFVEASKLREIPMEYVSPVISAEFDNLSGTDKALCSYDATKDIMTFTFDLATWNAADQSFRELMVFNIIGSCYLNKPNNDDATANGICESITRSDIATCTDNYNANTREAYLDEFFGL